MRANANCANKRHPRDYFKSQILVDTMVFSEEGLRHLVAEIGVSQIVYGTDVPFNWPVTVDLVLDAPFLSDADKEAILSGNARRLGSNVMPGLPCQRPSGSMHSAFA